MAQKAAEFVKNMNKVPKGAGAGIGALLALGGAIYGGLQSIFTGKINI